MKYLKREWIIFEGEAYNIATTSFDWITWRGTYECGYREPRYPVPAIRQGFEYGLRLGGGLTLLHWKQGVYDATGTDRR